MSFGSAGDLRRATVAQTMLELTNWKQQQQQQTSSSCPGPLLRTPQHQRQPLVDSMDLVSPEGRAWLSNLDAASRKRSQGSTLRQVPMDCFAVILSFLPKRYCVLELPTVSRVFRAAAQHPSLWSTFKLPELVATSELPVVSKFVVIKNLYASEKEHREHFWLRQLADGRFRGVKKLELQFASLHERDLRRVLSACPKLTGLDLSHCSGVTDDLLDVISESEVGSRSKALMIGDKTVAASKTSGSVLSTLSLSFCDTFSGDAFCQFARNTLAVSLREIDLSCCTSLRPEHFQEIFRTVKGLETVDARATLLSGESFKNIGAGHLAQLTSLNMSQCSSLSDDGLRLVALACPNLQTLNLSSCTMVTDRGVQHLEYLVDANGNSESGHTSNSVKNLNFDGCSNLTDSSLGMICVWFPRMQFLSVDRTNASIGTLSAVMHRLPKLESFSAVKCNYMKRDLFRDSALKKIVVENRRKLTFATGVFLEVAPHPTIKAMHRALQAAK